MLSLSHSTDFPSSVILAPGDTRHPGVAFTPSTSTLPSSTNRSASRLDANSRKHLLMRMQGAPSLPSLRGGGEALFRAENPGAPVQNDGLRHLVAGRVSTTCNWSLKDLTNRVALVLVGTSRCTSQSVCQWGLGTEPIVDRLTVQVWNRYCTGVRLKARSAGLNYRTVRYGTVPYRTVQTTETETRSYLNTLSFIHIYTTFCKCKVFL